MAQVADTGTNTKVRGAGFTPPVILIFSAASDIPTDCASIKGLPERRFRLSQA